MSTINYTGTAFIGEYEWERGTYITIKYIVLMGIPFIPIGTYRVHDSRLKETGFNYETTSYKLESLPMKWKYIIPILLIVYITAALTIVFMWLAFTSKNGLVKLMAIFGMFLSVVFGLAKLMNL